MRFSLPPVSVSLVVLIAACNPGAPTQPDGLTGTAPSLSVLSVEAADSPCTLAVHAVLREEGSTAVVGQIQFRVDPPEPGSTDPTVEYRGVYGPTGGPTFGVLGVALVSRVPEQLPTWSDVDKNDPGATLISVARFARVASMSQAMALALVDDPSRFKAVVNVVGSTGGREAEGPVDPERNVPESLRDRQRLCFGAGEPASGR